MWAAVQKDKLGLLTSQFNGYLGQFFKNASSIIIEEKDTSTVVFKYLSTGQKINPPKDPKRYNKTSL